MGDVMKTRQEIFNAAWNGLKSQGFERSMTDSVYGVCSYRGDGGRRCALGWCIPDERYRADLEGCDARHAKVLDAAGISYKDFGFAWQLQICHDSARDPNSMECHLRDFANHHGLTIPGERP